MGFVLVVDFLNAIHTQYRDWSRSVCTSCNSCQTLTGCL